VRTWEELQKLGYEVEVDSRTGAPEIKGFAKASGKKAVHGVSRSKRRQARSNSAAQQGINVKDGAGLKGCG
jgi:hypothetical protein